MDLRLTTLEGCGLAIGGYPRFSYDARGGSGVGRLDDRPACDRGGGDRGEGDPGGGDRDESERFLDFSPRDLRIPALTWRTTRILGLPLPPGLTIGIEPLTLSGHVAPRSGELRLRFQARFHCRAMGFYRPPPLRIDTQLSTGAVRSRRHRCQGQPLDSEGLALLVGVAQVPMSGDAWLDRFLGLPDEALALLRCRLSAPLSSG